LLLNRRPTTLAGHPRRGWQTGKSQPQRQVVANCEREPLGRLWLIAQIERERVEIRGRDREHALGGNDMRGRKAHLVRHRQISPVVRLALIGHQMKFARGSGCPGVLDTPVQAECVLPCVPAAEDVEERVVMGDVLQHAERAPALLDRDDRIAVTVGE